MKKHLSTNKMEPQEIERNQKKDLRAVDLPVEGSDQKGLWNHNYPLSSITQGEEEDTLYVDTPTHLKVFKFNHHTEQFRFEKSLPKKDSLGRPVLFDNQRRLFDNCQAGLAEKLTVSKSSQDPNFSGYLLTKYNYKDALQDKKEAIFVDQTHITSIPPNISISKKRKEPIESPLHYTSSHNLFLSEYKDINSDHEAYAIFSLSKKNKKEYFLRNYLTLGKKEQFNRFLDDQVLKDCKAFHQQHLMIQNLRIQFGEKYRKWENF